MDFLDRVGCAISEVREIILALIFGSLTFISILNFSTSGTGKSPEIFKGTRT